MLDFSLKTWNCFGLPQGLLAILRANGPPSAHRFTHADLNAAVAAPEILCIQELWLSHALELFERLPHPHKIRDRGLLSFSPPSLVGAGLGIASRFPFVASRLVRFQPPHAGADRLSRKGMLHARLLLQASPRVEIDLITAHWQAERDPAARKVRARQMVQLASLVEELKSPERPFFLCGDFNLNGLAPHRHEEYDALISKLDGFQDLGAADDRATFHPERNLLTRRFAAQEPAQRLDYIFLKQAPHGPRIEVRALEVALDQPLSADRNGPSTFASDHYALTARCRAWT